MIAKLPRQIVPIVFGAWVMIVAGGMFALARYKSVPGAQVPPPAAWPRESKLQRTPGKSTLVMMSHPRCPCTRASIAELELLLSQVGGQVDAYVLFVQPHGVDYDWTKTDLWQSASRISGVHVIRDVGGVEADRFDALTSGQVVLYDGEGNIQFNGGITGVRGHVGDNLGFQRLIALFHGGKSDSSESPVFGCPLHNSE